MPIRIRVVQSESETDAVYRLRYAVYVEELGRVQRHADHARRIIAEPLDVGATLLAAYDGDRVVGTLRTNYASRSDLRAYESLYQMTRVVPSYPAATSITTKLLVAPEYRHGPLAYRLAATAYREALRDGILHDFIDVYPERVPFFERLGYRVHLPCALHPEYGPVVVMRVDTRDVAHLRRVRSPFVRYLEHSHLAA